MKLRIRANTLRLRLSRSEVDQLARTGAVTDQIYFAPGQHFSYIIQTLPDAIPLRAAFTDHTLTIEVSHAAIAPWPTSDTIGIYGHQPIPNHPPLEISLEKDFSCLDRHSPTEDHDTFPHPTAQ